MKDTNFSFWCPVELSKAIDENTGEEIMLLGGIASTADEDSDGEFLDPKGFDIQPLINNGLVNWHHQAKTCPATIVGEPTKAEIRKEGLYIETKLYPSSQVARDIWDLAKTLDKDSTTRRLGYSIEGKVIKRKSEDKNSPDYKKIVKAIITGVAITHQPKNPKTFANIIKGEIDNDFEEDEETKEKETATTEEKSLDTDAARPLIKEDVDKKLKVTTFGKAEVIERIFQDIPGISIEKAKDIYVLIKKISNMAKKKTVTEEDILKAYDALGLEQPQDLSKGEEVDDSEATETDEVDEEDVAAPDKKVTKSEDAEDDDATDEDEVDDAENDVEETDEDDEDETEKSKSVKKGNIFNRFERIEKAIATSHLNNTTYIKALGVMVKAQSDNLEKAIESLNLANDKIDQQQEIIKAQQDTINSMAASLEAFGSSAPAPKSIRHAVPVERTFAKSNVDELNPEENISKAADEVSVTNKAAVAEILDQATFAKGYDEEFSKACMDYEATGRLTPNIVARIKAEYGITIK